MMDCWTSDELLTQLLEEQLDDAQAAPIIAHVETCVSCQERLKELTSESCHFLKWGYFGDDGSTPRTESIECESAAPGLQRRVRSARGAHTCVNGGEAGFPTIEGYEFLVELGHGGMGVVYKARQHRLSRMVAVKMLRAGSLARPEDLARFRIEAETVAKLQHVNIIQIFDIGETGGLPFVTFELLEGGSLEGVLAGRPHPEVESAELLATLARAIDVAHQAGVIHRDLKPSNVLFTDDGTPKITDFGLAKRLEEDGHTATGQVLGSPSYIPPEQADGRAKEASPETDVYALGAILYEMLTGRPPFKGVTAMETLHKVLHEDPAAPSRLQSHLSRDLETICLKCLAKAPHRRYATAAALADDLDRFRAGQPVRARRTPYWERVLKLVRRRPTAASLLAVACVIVLIAGVRFQLNSRSRMLEENQRVTGLREESERILARVRTHKVEGATAIETLSRLDGKISLEPKLADVHFEVAGLLEEFRSRRAALDRYREFFRRHEEALFQDTELTSLNAADNRVAIRKSAMAALEIYGAPGRDIEDWTISRLEDLSEPERKEVVRGCYEMLIVLAEAVAVPLPGEAAERQARRAIRILDRAAVLLPEPTHAIWMRRAACLERYSDLEGAKRAKSTAAGIQPSGALDQFLSGMERYKQGLLPQAKLHFEAALRVKPNHFWGKCLMAICDLNSRPPNAAEARTYLTACLRDHPDLPWLYVLRGFAYGQSGAAAADPAAAAAYFEAALADYREAVACDSGGRYRYAVLANRGLLYFERRNSAEAIADLTEAIALEPRQVNAYVTLAQVHWREQNIDLAMKRLGQAIALSPDQPALYRMRARWSLERRDATPEVRAAALADLREAIKREGDENAVTGELRALVARLLLEDKQFEEALHESEASLRINPKNAEVQRSRIVALLELKRYDEAVASCEAYMTAGHKTPELFGLRGLAKSKRRDFAGAIDDYTVALDAQPDDAALHLRRGWAYLMKRANDLARRDFDEAIRIDPGSGEAYAGRGSTLAALGQYREAARDAEESLRHGDVEAQLVYTAARTMAQAAGGLVQEQRPRGKPDMGAIRAYQDRALELLRRVIDQTPQETRNAFWRDVVETDPAFSSIRRLSEYTRMAEANRRSGR
jgi:eukaryotic-like serine/threonine-protein kinase